jgi:hypothetical protein
MNDLRVEILKIEKKLEVVFTMPCKLSIQIPPGPLNETY